MNQENLSTHPDPRLEEAPAEAPSEVKARYETLKGDFETLSTHGKESATELWSDLQRVTASARKLAEAWIDQVRGRSSAEAPEVEPKASNDGSAPV